MCGAQNGRGGLNISALPPTAARRNCCVRTGPPVMALGRGQSRCVGNTAGMLDFQPGLFRRAPASCGPLSVRTRDRQPHRLTSAMLNQDEIIKSWGSFRLSNCYRIEWLKLWKWNESCRSKHVPTVLQTHNVSLWDKMFLGRNALMLRDSDTVGLVS